MVVCRVIRNASFEKTARSRRCPALSVKVTILEDISYIFRVKYFTKIQSDGPIMILR